MTQTQRQLTEQSRCSWGSIPRTAAKQTKKTNTRWQCYSPYSSVLRAGSHLEVQCSGLNVWSQTKEAQGKNKTQQQRKMLFFLRWWQNCARASWCSESGRTTDRLVKGEVRSSMFHFNRVQHTHTVMFIKSARKNKSLSPSSRRSKFQQVTRREGPSAAQPGTQTFIQQPPRIDHYEHARTHTHTHAYTTDAHIHQVGGS